MRSKSMFWQIENPNTTRGLAEWDESVDFSDPVRCSENRQHYHRRWPKDLSVILTSRKCTDFIWTWHMDLLIQDRVLEMFQDHDFTGFDVTPVSARMKIRSKDTDLCDETPGIRIGESRGVQVPPLWKLIITGWGGVAPQKSGIKLIERCRSCNRQTYTAYKNPSHLIDIDQWDGSDFFIIWPMPLFVFVTDRVAQLIINQKLTGVVLTSIDQMKRPKWLPNTLSPGRLREWLPDERAREIGEPLGIY